MIEKIKIKRDWDAKVEEVKKNTKKKSFFRACKINKG